MTHDARPLTVAEAVDALTNPYRHVEPIPEWTVNRNRRVRRIWVTTQPSLLDQLAAAVVPGESYAEDDAGGHATPASRPAARLDAIDRLLAIEAGTGMWCLKAGLILRETTTGNLRALVGAHLDSGRARELLSDLAVWHTWAVTVTGWQSPAFRPTAPCPACSQRDGLRVRLARSVACCMHCGAAWDATTIGLLAEHVIAYDKTMRTAAAAKREEERTARRAGAA